MKKHILERLSSRCHFEEVFKGKQGSLRESDRKIGHVRADYDGWRWFATSWPCHRELETPDIVEEITAVYHEITAKDALCDLEALRRFCRAHPEACKDQEYRDDFYFYLDGQFADFWVRLITRRGDYNMYLSAYIKARCKDGC